MSSPSFQSLQLLLLLLLLLSPLPFLAKGDADLIEKTCASTNHYSLCKDTIYKDSSAISADLPGLARIILRASWERAGDGAVYASRQFHQVEDPVLSDVFLQCSKIYQNARDTLLDAWPDLDEGVWHLAHDKLNSAMGEPEVCHTKFTEKKLAYPGGMDQVARTLLDLCDVVLSIVISQENE